MDDIKKQVQNFYDEAGEYFSRTRQRKNGQDANWEEVKQYLNKLKPGERVLDLGCGNGRLLTGLAKGVDYVGVDFSKTLIKEAKKLHPQARFIMGDIAKETIWSKIGKKKFKAIFCIATLHHVPTRTEQLFVLKKMRKVLQDDGFVYVSVWNLWQKRYLKYHFDPKTKIKNVRWVYVPFMNKWKRFCFAFDKFYLAQLMFEAGYKIEKLFYANKQGESSNWIGGRNLVVIGKKK